MNSDLTISIVSHGHGSLLDRLLGDLNRQASSDRPTVILTYNVPETPVDTARYPRLRIVAIHNDRPSGFGANHNAAFGKCETRWFAALNPDLRLPSEPFATLLAAAAKAERPGVIAPTVVNSGGALEDAVRKNLTPLSLLLRRAIGSSKPHAHADRRSAQSFFWIAGMFMLFPSEAFREIGGFDERFFLYCEDYDICARLHLAGYTLVVDPTTSVVHDAQRDSHRSMKHLRLHLTSLLKVWMSSAFWRITIYA
jgi:N-acetylglucosaminyl-diphospho-decaprenol L-rhamnosyltransferase